MHCVFHVLVCLACVSDGRREHGLQIRVSAESLKHTASHLQRRMQASSALHQLKVLHNLLLVFCPAAAFQLSSLGADSIAIHRQCSSSLAVAVGGHNRIRMPLMNEVAGATEAPLLVSALSTDGFLSAKAADTTALVNEASQLQGLSGLACDALGRALTCCLLLAEPLEEKEVFQTKFDGDGPIRGVLASANGALESRGKVGNPKLFLPPNAIGAYDVGTAVGLGNLFVTRTKVLPGATREIPYNSVASIQTGEVAEDINFYLAESEQRVGALAAGVFVNGTNSPDSARSLFFCILQTSTAVARLIDHLRPPP